MTDKRTYRMAVNPMTGNLEWAQASPHVFHSMAGWLLLAVSTLLFLVVASYFAYVFLLSSPRIDLARLPGGGPSVMREEVQTLR